MDDIQHIIAVYQQTNVMRGEEMAGDVAALLVSIAAGLTAIDQISIIITTKRLWKQQQQLQQQLEMLQKEWFEP